MSDIEAKRAANRAAFPAVTKIVDEFREQFGDGITVQAGSENGKSFGQLVELPPDSDKVFSGDRLVLSGNCHPIEFYKQQGMGRRR